MDTRCGLLCEECSFRESHGCKGCIATNGNPFHGACPIAMCCQERGNIHCGQCEQFPCEQLMQYSCDPIHGDHPQGLRIGQCVKWLREESVR